MVAYLDSPVAGASTNLAVSGLGALAGTARHARDGRVSLPVLVLMGVPSALGAFLGVVLFVKVNRLVVQGCWKATRGRDLQPAPHTPAEVHELEDEEDEWPEWP